MSDVSSGRGAVNSAPKTLTNQFGNQPTVVDMSMGEENSVQGMRRNRKWSPVPVFKLSFLIDSTVNQQPGIIGFQKILGTGNIAGGSQKV